MATANEAAGAALSPTNKVKPSKSSDNVAAAIGKKSQPKKAASAVSPTSVGAIVTVLIVVGAIAVSLLQPRTQTTPATRTDDADADPEPFKYPEYTKPAKRVKNFYDNSRSSDAQKERALFEAISNADSRAVASLLQAGADPHCNGTHITNYLPPLHFAAHLGTKEQFQIIHMLLAAGADPNYYFDADVNTRPQAVAPAIYYSIGFPDREPLEEAYRHLFTLLEYGADPNLMTVHGVYRLTWHVGDFSDVPPLGSMGLLHWAALVGDTEAVHQLLLHKADINRRTTGLYDGYTPLHFVMVGAGSILRTRLLREVLAHGADITAVNADMENALFIAVKKRSLPLAKILLRHARATGVAPESIILNANKNGINALQLAAMAPVHQPLFALLAEHAQSVSPPVTYNPRDQTKPFRASWEAAPRGEWRWESSTPLDIDWCDIDRVDYKSLSVEDFTNRYYHLDRPVIFTGNMTSEWAAWSRWQKPQLIKNYGDASLSAGAVPFADLLGRSSKQLSLAKFVSKMNPAHASVLKGRQNLQKEPWIMVDRTAAINKPAFREDYKTPEYFGRATGLEPLLQLGSFGSGYNWHHGLYDMDAVMFGRQRWFMAPPALQDKLLAEQGRFANGINLFMSALHPLRWFYELYHDNLRNDAQIFQCVQGPGEVMFVPAAWSRSTIWLSEGVSFSMEFFNDKGFEMELAPFFEYRRVFGERSENRGKDEGSLPPGTAGGGAPPNIPPPISGPIHVYSDDDAPPAPPPPDADADTEYS